MTKPAWILVALLIAGHLVVDFFVPMSFSHGPDNIWLFAILMGISVGQINLIGVWAAMTPGRVMLRLPWSIVLATLMWYAMVLGSRVGRWWEFGNTTYHFNYWFKLQDALLLGVVLLAGVLVIQLPLWVASRQWRWRLVTPKFDTKSHYDERQFNLKHLIAGMAIVSVIFGLGRIILPPGDFGPPRFDRELAVLLPAIGIVNLLVAAPCVWVAFARSTHLLGWAGAWFAYVTLISIAEVATLAVFLSAPPIEIWLAFILLNLAQCVAVAGTLACLRGVGFRLVRVEGVKQLPLEQLGATGAE